MEFVIFLLFACILGLVGQVVTLPLAMIMGLRNQWALGFWGGAALAAYIVYFQ